MPRIAFIDPAGPENTCPLLKEELEKTKRPETGLEFVCLERSPGHLEYQYYEALVIPDSCTR